MRRTTTLLIASILLVGALAAPAIAHSSDQRPVVPSARAGANPTPAHDPFYKVPKDIARYRNGEVIRSRSITARSFQITLPAKAWQLLYRTENFRGHATATVTTVLVPTAAWKGKGPRPLLSYQTAEDGVSRTCAPSYAFRTGLSDAASNSYDESSLMMMALDQGWAVDAPDYEGPRSEFLVAGTEGREILDGLRAARSFRPDHVSHHAALGLWGYSGGAFASANAAQLQPSYAPKLHLRAVALGGLVSNVTATINAFSGSVGGGAIPMGINGFLRAYPKLHLLRYLNASGREKVKVESHDCIDQAVARYPFLSITQIEARPNALSSPPVAGMLRDNSPLFRKGIPNASIYEYHATGDEFAPIEPARAWLKRMCRHHVAVDHVEFPIGEHLTELATGSPGALAYLGDRFAGKQVPDTCSSIK